MSDGGGALRSAPSQTATLEGVRTRARNRRWRKLTHNLLGLKPLSTAANKHTQAFCVSRITRLARARQRGLHVQTAARARGGSVSSVEIGEVRRRAARRRDGFAARRRRRHGRNSRHRPRPARERERVADVHAARVAATVAVATIGVIKNHGSEEPPEPAKRNSARRRIEISRPRKSTAGAAGTAGGADDGHPVGSFKGPPSIGARAAKEAKEREGARVDRGARRGGGRRPSSPPSCRQPRWWTAADTWPPPPAAASPTAPTASDPSRRRRPPTSAPSAPRRRAARSGPWRASSSAAAAAPAARRRRPRRRRAGGGGEGGAR